MVNTRPRLLEIPEEEAQRFVHPVCNPNEQIPLPELPLCLHETFLVWHSRAVPFANAPGALCLHSFNCPVRLREDRGVAADVAKALGLAAHVLVFEPCLTHSNCPC